MSNSVLEPDLWVTGHRVTGSTIFGRVGSGHGSVWQTRCLTWFFSAFACALLLLLVREYATSESVGYVFCIFTSSCLLARILVICYVLVMLEIFVICKWALRKPETFGRKHSLVAHRRQNNLLVQIQNTYQLAAVTCLSCLSRLVVTWSGRVTMFGCSAWHLRGTLV